MNRQGLIDKIAKDADVTKKAASIALKSLIEGITLSLEKGEKVSLVGFGTFKATKRKARTGRNPQTGRAIKIPARKVPVFRPGKELKSKVK